MRAIKELKVSSAIFDGSAAILIIVMLPPFWRRSCRLSAATLRCPNVTRITRFRVSGWGLETVI
jgi:hypothetical protein